MKVKQYSICAWSSSCNSDTHIFPGNSFRFEKDKPNANTASGGPLIRSWKLCS